MADTSGAGKDPAAEFAAKAQKGKDAGTLPGHPIDKNDLSKGATEIPQREREDGPSETPYTPDGLPTD